MELTKENKYICMYCKFHVSNTFKSHLSHNKSYHGNINKYFHCGFNGCKRIYPNELNLRNHIIKIHKVSTKFRNQTHSQDSFHSVKNSSAQFVCPEVTCQQKFVNYDYFIKHIKSHMRHGKMIACPVANCAKQYNHVQSFSSHLSKQHRNFDIGKTDSNSICEIDEIENVSKIESTENIVWDNDSFPFNNEILDNQKETSVNLQEYFLLNFSQLFLKLESTYLIPISTIQYLITEIKNIYDQCNDINLEKLHSLLLENNLNEANVNSIITKLSNSDVFYHAYNVLNTAYKRKEFYKKKFSYVEPEKVLLRINNNKQEFFHYISIVDTLKAMMSDKSLASYLQRDFAVKPYTLSDFTDGTAYTTNKFFQSNPNALKIILYQDSFEIVNPLGAAKKKYKILAVYMSLGNLPDYIRSHINSIQLVALCIENQFDHNVVYGRIVADLKILETQGVEISPNVFRKAGLIFITGDNLGSHALGGFVENFSSTPYICRYCTFEREKTIRKKKKGIIPSVQQLKISSKNIHRDKLCSNKKIKNSKKKLTIVASKVSKNTKNQNKTNIVADQSKARKYRRVDYPPRTVENYTEAIEYVRKNEVEHYQGIKFDSVFNQLESFHVCNSGLPPCLGHDLMEGVIAFDLHVFIKDLIKKKWLSCTELNNKIESFDYSPHDLKDKPAKVMLSKEKLVGGAHQLWNFLKLFPLIIRNKIKNPDDLTWQSILILTEITEIVSAQTINSSILPYLQDKIDEYLSLRIQFNIPLRPKHHFLSHYPEFFIKFGPLIKVWTLRFESKHTFFKRVIRAIKNFLNVTLTLSEKHELFQSLLRLGSDLRPEVQTKKLTQFTVTMYNENIIKSILALKIDINNLQQCSAVTIKGTEYKHGDAIFLKQTWYQCDVKFGKIILILYNDFNQDIIFVLQKCKTTFDPIIRFYELQSTEFYECISINDLENYFPLWIYQLGLRKGVKLQYAITREY